MRTLRMSLAGTVLLALLAGVSGAVVAQDEPADPMVPVVVTGTMELGTYTAIGTETFDAAGVSRAGTHEGNYYYEASDPRLDGKVTFRENELGYEHPTDGVVVTPTTRVLVNDDGRWVATNTGLRLADGTDTDMDFIVWQGEDAYEGLTAIIVEGWEGDVDDPDRDPYSFIGTIVAGMPPYPEPPAE